MHVQEHDSLTIYIYIDNIQKIRFPKSKIVRRKWKGHTILVVYLIDCMYIDRMILEKQELLQLYFPRL